MSRPQFFILAIAVFNVFEVACTGQTDSLQQRNSQTAKNVKSPLPVPDSEQVSNSKRPQSGSSNDLRQLEKLINDLAKEHMPHKYEKKKNWGEQAERWDGLHIQLKDFRLKTKRRKRLVNHGTWKMYSAELADPRKGLRFKLNSIQKNAKGNAVINLSITAHLNLFGRISEWVKGVQVYSISADGQANVTLHMVATIGTSLDFTNLPPDVCLRPIVNNATLTVHDFRIKRVSKLGGEFAQQVGRGVRKILDDKIKEYETKLVQKLNKSIAKKNDDLRLSAADLVKSEWSKFATFINDKETTEKEIDEKRAESAEKADPGKPVSNKIQPKKTAPQGGKK